MRVGVIGAMRIEVERLAAELSCPADDVIGGVAFRAGTVGGAEVVAAECGAGKVNAAICAQTMILRHAPDYIVNIGVAGGLNPDLRPGELLLADAVLQYDLDTTALGDPPGLIPKLGLCRVPCSEELNRRFLALEPGLPMGAIATGDRFLTSAAQGGRIAKEFGASAVDMESGSIGQVCYVNNTPFTVLRAISDRADGAAPGEFDGNAERAALAPIELILRLLRAL